MKEVHNDISLEDLRSGSPNILKKVYEDNRNKFLNFARRYNLSEDENIDIYQDTYVIFYDNVMSGKIEKFTSSISTYMFSIGKYLIMEKMRMNKKIVSRDFDLRILRNQDEIINSIEFETSDITEEQKLLQKYFGTLGEKCQELLKQFYYRGLTINEIMQLGDYENENVVKASKSRCMKTLRDRIKENN